jgi:hypothetical protein
VPPGGTGEVETSPCGILHSNRCYIASALGHKAWTDSNWLLSNGRQSNPWRTSEGSLDALKRNIVVISMHVWPVTLETF